LDSCAADFAEHRRAAARNALRANGEGTAGRPAAQAPTLGAGERLLRFSSDWTPITTKKSTIGTTAIVAEPDALPGALGARYGTLLDSWCATTEPADADARRAMIAAVKAI